MANLVVMKKKACCDGKRLVVMQIFGKSCIYISIVRSHREFASTFLESLFIDIKALNKVHEREH